MRGGWRALHFVLRISANVTDDFGNVTGLGPVLGCADLIVEMESV